MNQIQSKNPYLIFYNINCYSQEMIDAVANDMARGSNLSNQYDEC